MNLKSSPWNFPGGPGVKNPPSNAGDTGSIPGQGTKIPHAVWHSQKRKIKVGVEGGYSHVLETTTVEQS